MCQYDWINFCWFCFSSEIVFFLLFSPDVWISWKLEYIVHPIEIRLGDLVIFHISCDHRCCCCFVLFSFFLCFLINVIMSTCMKMWTWSRYQADDNTGFSSTQTDSAPPTIALKCVKSSARWLPKQIKSMPFSLAHLFESFSLRGIRMWTQCARYVRM